MSDFHVTGHALDNIRKRCNLCPSITNAEARKMMLTACKNPDNWTPTEEKDGTLQFFVRMEANTINRMSSDAYLLCKKDTMTGSTFSIITVYDYGRYLSRKDKLDEENVFLRKMADKLAERLMGSRPGHYALMVGSDMFVGEREEIHRHIQEALEKGIPQSSLRVFEHKSLKVRLEIA